MPSHRRNPPRPPVPPRRPGAAATTRKDQGALARVRRMASSLDERDRPFNPERPGSWRGSSRDLVVNGRMDEFTRGFLETALWSTNDESDDSDGDYPEPQATRLTKSAEKFGDVYLTVEDGVIHETWNEEALEAGETDDKGWVEEGSAEEGLDDLLNNSDIKDHNWVEWSASNPYGKRSWLIAEEEEDMRTGERTVYNLWIERADGKPKSQEEIDAISEKLGISNFGRMRRNRK